MTSGSSRRHRGLQDQQLTDEEFPAELHAVCGGSGGSDWSEALLRVCPEDESESFCVAKP